MCADASDSAVDDLQFRRFNVVVRVVTLRGLWLQGPGYVHQIHHPGRSVHLHHDSESVSPDYTAPQLQRRQAVSQVTWKY